MLDCKSREKKRQRNQIGGVTMDAINEFSYAKEVEASADFIMREVAAEGLSFEDCQDRLHEYVGGHQWIIYNYYHLYILEYSRNENYGMDEGLVEGIKDWSDMKQAMAFWAFHADIANKLNEEEFLDYVSMFSKYRWYGNYFQDMPELTWEQVESCSGSGNQDTNVELLLDAIGTTAFDSFSEDIAKELKEYGTWDDVELLDTEENKRRILWLACCDIAENWESYKV
jgi:hypothetical protein